MPSHRIVTLPSAKPSWRARACRRRHALAACAATLSLLLAAPPPACAADEDRPAVVAQSGAIDRAAAVALAQQRYLGELLDVQERRDGPSWGWEVRLLAPDGQVVRVRIAHDGSFESVKGRDLRAVRRPSPASAGGSR